MSPGDHKRQWRDYQTATGGRPVKKFLLDLTSEERAAVLAAMKEVELEGLSAAKHLRGDIYEVKADTADKFFRVLFAAEGSYNQVLLSLEAFSKKSRKTPPAKLELAARRLRDWRRRGDEAKREAARKASARGSTPRKPRKKA